MPRPHPTVNTRNAPSLPRSSTTKTRSPTNPHDQKRNNERAQQPPGRTRFERSKRCCAEETVCLGPRCGTYYVLTCAVSRRELYPAVAWCRKSRARGDADAGRDASSVPRRDMAHTKTRCQKSRGSKVCCRTPFPPVLLLPSFLLQSALSCLRLHKHGQHIVWLLAKSCY